MEGDQFKQALNGGRSYPQFINYSYKTFSVNNNGKTSNSIIRNVVIKMRG